MDGNTLQILSWLIIMIINYIWANSKGFSGFSWVFAGGIFAWILLVILMPAKGPKCPPELIKKRARRGNIIGLSISGIVVCYSIFTIIDELRPPPF
jgi:hypothetical protein